MDVPESLIANTDPELPVAVVSWQQPSATDNSGEPVTITSNFNSGDTFPLGITNILYTATDKSGNKVSAMFTIFVSGKISRTRVFYFFFESLKVKA